MRRIVLLVMCACICSMAHAFDAPEEYSINNRLLNDIATHLGNSTPTLRSYKGRTPLPHQLLMTRARYVYDWDEKRIPETRIQSIVESLEGFLEWVESDYGYKIRNRSFMYSKHAKGQSPNRIPQFKLVFRNEKTDYALTCIIEFIHPSDDLLIINSTCISSDVGKEKKANK